MNKNTLTLPAAFVAFVLLVLSFIYCPIFAYQFVTTKWLSFYGFSVVAVVYLFTRPRFYLPHTSRFVAVAAAMSIFLMIVTLRQKVPVGYEAVASDRLSSLAFFLFFYSAFASEKLDWSDFVFPALVALAGSSVIGLAQAIRVGLTGEMPYFSMASTMGHTNNAAQWIAGLLCLVVPFLSRIEGKAMKFIAYFVVLISVFYIFLARARSIWIFIALAVILLGWNFRRLVFQRFKKHVLAFSAAFVLLAGMVIYYGGDAFLHAKASMSLYRATIWKATARMIFDNPLGYGPDQFEFWHLPYIRNSVIVNYRFLARSPHNEFLRYPVEDGMIVSAIIAFLLATVIYRFFRVKEITAPERTVVFLLLLFFGVESLFQFPFQTSQTVFLFTALVGFMLFKAFPVLDRSNNPFRPVLAILLLALATVSYRVAYSHFYERSNDYSAVSRACDAFPGNWNVCFRRGGMEVRSNDLVAARRTLERALEMSPYNYFALRNLSTVAFMEGHSRQNTIEGCYYLWKHNFLFGERSPIYDYQFKRCDKKILDYLDRKRPEKFYGRQY